MFSSLHLKNCHPGTAGACGGAGAHRTARKRFRSGTPGSKETGEGRGGAGGRTEPRAASPRALSVAGVRHRLTRHRTNPNAAPWEAAAHAGRNEGHTQSEKPPWSWPGRPPKALGRFKPISTPTVFSRKCCRKPTLKFVWDLKGREQPGDL